MQKWFMLTLVGNDRPGIVAHVSNALYEGGCHLGEASMMRLGGNFTIMLMVKFAGNSKALYDLLSSVTDSLSLNVHVDQIDAQLHEHRVPDVLISVHGADRAGIVAQVTRALAEAGLDILDLESDVGGSAQAPIYIMQIEGVARAGLPALRAALEAATRDTGIFAQIEPIETLVG
ncbi:MAG: ACT domain-containing protein [Pseudomonadota bacterium]